MYKHVNLPPAHAHSQNAVLVIISKFGISYQFDKIFTILSIKIHISKFYWKKTSCAVKTRISQWWREVNSSCRHRNEWGRSPLIWGVRSLTWEVQRILLSCIWRIRKSRTRLQFPKAWMFLWWGTPICLSCLNYCYVHLNNYFSSLFAFFECQNLSLVFVRDLLNRRSF